MGKKEKANTGELVLSALNKLMKNTGWTTRTITKFIKLEYQMADRKLSRKVSRSLKRGVKLGLLLMANGRYRLNEHMSQVVKRIRTSQIQHRPKRPQKGLRVRTRTPSPVKRRTNL